MKKILKSILLLMAVTAGTATFVACSDDDLPAADALFRPVISVDDNIEQGLDENAVPYVIINWDNYTSANQYTVKIESFDGSDSREITTENTTCRFDNMKYDMEYNISLSSANTVTGLSSKPYSVTMTTLDFPTSLITPATTDLIDIQARISWQEGVEYDQLRVINDETDELVGEYEVTADDNAAANKIISGLEPKTTYRVEAYRGGTYQGKKRITTVASEKYEGEVVDLRGLSESESLKWISTDHIDSIVNEYPDKDINIILQGGMHYRLETVKLPSTQGTLKFVTGLTLAGNAVWNVTGNFDLANGINLGGISFERISFTDDESKLKTSSNYGGTYLFNQNSDAVIGTVSLKSCDVRYKRGVLRIRGTNVVESFIADDCIFEYIGGYGITNVDNNGAAIKNIKVTNSTFADCVRLFVNTKSKDIECGTVDIENCTFAYFAGSSRGLIELQENVWKGGINIKNCIYGSCGEVHTAPQEGIKGWTGTVVPTLDNVFFTSDLVWALKADGTPNNAFEGTTLSTDTKGTFKDPNPEGTLMPGDYTLINTDAIKAKVGDPRWLK
ncbi:MAG: DUF5123 domain-containing protein [Prevotella sp.]|nr:DUF5123 domain-containing protein [Prevotella sp.]